MRIPEIDCAEPLPPDVHAIFVEMDRRYQAAYAMIRKGVEVEPEQARWTLEERQAHRFLDEHIAANLI